MTVPANSTYIRSLLTLLDQDSSGAGLEPVPTLEPIFCISEWSKHQSYLDAM